ncbi:eCIS core domain-containing protein [Paenibacillus ferrarius]|uniref:eCIS core domain-containing protein n=1 Tax=Paenibacillus ferrarius TaxID=1469647 RepID=UPI003D2A0F67
MEHLRINRQPDTSLQHQQRNHKSQPQAQSAAASELSNIQRTIGNRALGSMLGIQTKLTVGPAGDAYEQEADQMGKAAADHIQASESAAAGPDVQRSEEESEFEDEGLQMKPSMDSIQRSEGEEMEGEDLQMKASSESIQRSEGEEMEGEDLQMKASSESIQRSEGEEMEGEDLQMKASSESIQRSEGDEMEGEELQMKPSSDTIQLSGGGPNEEEEPLQMKGEAGEGFEADAGIEEQIKSKQGSGSPMAPDVQAKMESAFNTDFSSVNIHTDSDSSMLNRSLGAEAFATGNDVFFREGRYNPDTREGQELLGHELTHVVQQRGGK